MYVLVLDELDRDLIDITCLHPEPVEAFSFEPLNDGKVRVSTVSKKRLHLWTKALEKENKKFKVSAS